MPFNGFFDNKIWSNKGRALVLFLMALLAVGPPLEMLVINTMLPGDSLSADYNMTEDLPQNTAGVDGAHGVQLASVMGERFRTDKVANGYYRHRIVRVRYVQLALSKCISLNRELRSLGRSTRNCYRPNSKVTFTHTWYTRSSTASAPSVVLASFNKSDNAANPYQPNIPPGPRCQPIDQQPIAGLRIEQDMWLWKVTMNASYRSENGCGRVKWVDVTCSVNHAVFWDVTINACKAVPALNVTIPFRDTWVFGSWTQSFVHKDLPIRLTHCFRSGINPQNHWEWNFRQGC